MHFLLLPSATHIYVRAFPYPESYIHNSYVKEIARYDGKGTTDLIVSSSAGLFTRWWIERGHAITSFSPFSEDRSPRAMSVPFPQIRKDPMNAGSSERGGCGSEIERLCELQGSDHTTTTPPLQWPTGVVCSHIGKSSHSNPLEVFTVHTLKIPHTACWIIASKVSTHREGRAVATPTLSMCSTLRIASAYTFLPNIYASPLNPQSHFDVGFWQIWASLLLLMVCPPDLGKVYKLNGASEISSAF